MPVTGSIGGSSQKIKHNYLSAVGQSGIAAGEGGFDIKANGNTDLIGAAITSTAAADKNRLTTTSLTSRDLDNAQTTKASSSSMSLAYGGGSATATMAGNATANLLGNLSGNAALPKNQSEKSQTQSVISPATITITGSGNAAQDEQSQRTATELTSRDPNTANDSLKNTLTLQQASVLQKEIHRAEENMEAAKLVGAVLANAVGDVANSRQGQLQRQENLRALAAGEDAKTISAWGEGSAEKIALHGLVGLIQAKVGGGSAAVGALAGMAHETLLPTMRSFLDSQGFDESTPERKQIFDALMNAGSALLGAGVGFLASGNVQGASAGANVSFIADVNNRQLHLDEKKILRDRANAKAEEIAAERSAEDKQKISARLYILLEAEMSPLLDQSETEQNAAYRQQLAQTVQSNLEGFLLAEKELKAMDWARSEALALQTQYVGQTIKANGQDLIANGSAVKFFQSTSAQYSDSDLFNSVLRDVLLQQFAGNANPETIIGQAQSTARDGTVNAVDRYQADALAAMHAKSGGLLTDTTDLDLATLGVAGLIKSGERSLLGKMSATAGSKVAQGTVVVGAKAAETEIVGPFTQLGSREAIASARAYKAAFDSDQTLVIGRLADANAGADLGMRRLYDADWTLKVNDAWIQGGINARKPFYLGSNISISNLRSGDGLYPLTVLFRELKQLRDANYFRQGDWMMPPVK